MPKPGFDAVLAGLRSSAIVAAVAIARVGAATPAAHGRAISDRARRRWG